LFVLRLVFQNSIEKSLERDKPDTLSTQIHERSLSLVALQLLHITV
jgi:hypothetical protein